MSDESGEEGVPRGVEGVGVFGAGIAEGGYEDWSHVEYWWELFELRVEVGANSLERCRGWRCRDKESEQP